jgi:hypothetical protein
MPGVQLQTTDISDALFVLLGGLSPDHANRQLSEYESE